RCFQRPTPTPRCWSPTPGANTSGRSSGTLRAPSESVLVVALAGCLVLDKPRHLDRVRQRFLPVGPLLLAEPLLHVAHGGRAVGRHLPPNGFGNFDDARLVGALFADDGTAGVLLAGRVFLGGCFVLEVCEEPFAGGVTDGEQFGGELPVFEGEADVL